MSETKNAIYEANEYAKELQTNLVAILGESIGRLEAESLERLTLLTESGYYFIKSGINWGIYSPEIAWLEGFTAYGESNESHDIATRLAEIYTRLTRAKLTPEFLPENANRVKVSLSLEYWVEDYNAPQDFGDFMAYFAEEAAAEIADLNKTQLMESLKVEVL